MKTAKKAPKKVLNMTPEVPFPKTFQGQLEKWGLPVVFVLIGLAIVWAVVMEMR